MTRKGGRKNQAASTGVLQEKPTVAHVKKTFAKHNRRKKNAGTASSESSDQVKHIAKDDTRPLISKNFIKGLPLRQWDGPIQLLQTKHDMQTAVCEIISNNPDGGCLGFDIESKPVFRKHQFHPPALLQIATSDTVYLFRLCELHGKRTPNSKAPHNSETFAFLLPLLTDPRFIKAGVGVLGDAKGLRSLVTFEPQGFCELADLAKKSIRSLSLKALAAHFLQCQVSKSKSTTMSDWTQPLTNSQIQYAATDAWLGRAIWNAIQVQENEMNGVQQPDSSSLVSGL